MELLEKLENAIKSCEKSKVEEISVTLSYSDLLLLKRHEEANNFALNLSKESLKRASNFYKRK